MDKKRLQDILSEPYQSENWVKVLQEVFGVRNILQKPSPIILPSNKKAEAAFELGSFNTSDDRIIGLYLVKVKPEVWLEKNKVGLRELLRSIYKYEVDGALIVFEQQDKWRLSFVSEIRSIDEGGSITTTITEPKRYTYLLGKGEKTKTPVTRLNAVAGKKNSLEDIRNVFSVETLNEEFYKILARYFYQLVGATEGKGAKAIAYERILKLPGSNPKNKAELKKHQEFAVRLIGRTIFCWFLKVKKSDAGISLLPEHLLSSEAVRKNSNYYHFILEKLFFQTLNTPMKERITNLPVGCEQVPFLNGGLFEPQREDCYEADSTGLSTNINTLAIPNEWFQNLFENLEQYNFTIDENSVVDIEVSIDPEMLGRIFENLLAEIDPDSGETARKATGSFYTPREIVDYMVTESLVYYLYNKTQLSKESLYPIFKMDSKISFSEKEREIILIALDSLKILDPACGSGAFPMGVLQKVVMALEKLDKNAEWWIKQQVEKNTHPYAREAVKQKLKNNPEYARKIGIIQNTLYGVDIQPIAAEISKLRCFLTLIVDENIDESKPNRGIEPLPNLEFKFVTADALLKLPEKNFGNLFNADSQDDLAELQQIRLDYLQSYGEQKNELKIEFRHIQDKIVKQQTQSRHIDTQSRASLISTWNPFSNEKVDWFDPLLMFGLEMQGELKKENYLSIEVERINKQIRAINAQIDAINISVGSKHSVSIIKLQLITANLQASIIENEISALKDKIDELYGNIEHEIKNVVAESENLTYQITSLNNTIDKLNDKLKKLNDSIKPVVSATRGGYFDIVIGNPPYISYYSNTGSTLTKEQRKYFVDNYDSIIKENDRINSMNLFSERGLNLLKQEGIISYIVNKTFAVLPSYSEIRKFLLKNSTFDYLASGLDPFKAIVDCVVFGAIRSENDDYRVRWYNGNIINSELVEISQFKKNRNYELHSSKDTSIISKIETAKNKLEDILIINRGVNIGGQFDLFLSKTKKDEDYYKFIAGIKSLDKYTFNWDENSDCYFKFDQVLESKLRNEGATMVLGNPERYLKEKLFIPESAQYLLASYVKERIYSAYGIMVGTQQDNRYNIKYACAIINSKLFTFYAIEKEILRKGSKATPHIGVKGLNSLPVHLVTQNDQTIFINLVDYILSIKNRDIVISVNEDVPNSHIAQLFEEIIDALVYELYFEEDFKKADIAFMKYAQRDFKSIEGLGEKEIIKTISDVYQKLREKDNEIRQNLKLMDTRLAELIMPIKTAK